MAYTTGDVAELFCVSQRTVRRWIKSGQLEAHRTPAARGEWRIPASEVQRYQGVRADHGEYIDQDRAVLYARVREANDGLLNHIEVHLKQHAARKNYHVEDVIRDTASGIDEGREGLAKLRRYILNGRVEVVVVERLDRILLAGYSEFEHWATAAKVRIEETGVISEEVQALYAREIVEDLFFPLADALALATDRTRAEQATARALADVWGFLDLEAGNVRPDAIMSELSVQTS